MSLLPENSYQFLKGPEKAPLLVMLPGMACSGQVFKEGFGQLLRHFNLLLLNNPGTAGAPLDYGQGHGALDIQHLANVAQAATEDVLKTELTPKTPVYLAGHSMGGFVAQLLAHDWPKVEKLVLMNTSMGGPANDRSLTNFWLEMTIENATGHRVVAQHGRGLFAMMLPKGADDAAIDAVEAYFHDQPPMKEHALLKHYLCGARFTSLLFIRDITCPTLVVHGEKDRVIPLETAHDMAEQLPNARMWVVPDEGHMVFWQRPSTYDRMCDYLLGDDTVGDAVTQQPAPDIFTQQQNQLWYQARKHITSLNTLLHTWGI